jgi:hypothetical protein
MFDSVFGYLRSSRARLATGHTMQIGDGEYLRFRTANAGEAFLESEGGLLVAEIIGPHEVNR